MNKYEELSKRYKDLMSRISAMKTMDFMLYNYAYEPSRCQSFRSCEEMAEFFRIMLHTCLPKQYWYEEELPQKSVD